MDIFANGSFDATSVAPNQGGGKVMPGIHDAVIANTYGKPTAAGDGGMICIEFETASGMLTNRYNVWNKSDKAVEIAQGQMSALCHATGIFRITASQTDLANCVRELRGARCKIKVDWQKGDEPSEEKPQGGWCEVKKVLDVHGNEPGKANTGPAAAPAQPTQQAQPAGWTAAPAAQETAPVATAAPAAWAPGNGAAAAAPPWGAK